MEATREDVSSTPTLSVLRVHRDEILRIAERRGVSNVRIFGSCAGATIRQIATLTSWSTSIGVTRVSTCSASADATHQATSGIRAPNVAEAVLAARADLRHALDARADLQRGAGPYQHSEAGRAVRDLQQARVGLDQARHAVQHAPRWRDRRAATKEQALWAQREADALHRHDLHVTPEVARLDRTIEVCRSAVEHVEAHAEQYRQAEQAVVDLTHTSSRDVSRFSTHLTIYRNDIEGLPQPPVLRPARPAHAQQARLPAPTVEPPAPQPPDLGIGM